MATASGAPWARRATLAVERIFYAYRVRLTDRGRFVLAATGALALLGLETRRNYTFMAYSLGLALLTTASLFAWRRPPTSRLKCSLPTRATAQRPTVFRGEVEHVDFDDPSALLVSFPARDPWEPNVVIEPRTIVVPPATAPARRYDLEMTLTAPRRGAYALHAPTLRALDPMRLIGTRARPDSRGETLLVYPAIFPLDSLEVGGGRRYQSGGAPRAHSTADAVEFIGTRDYRPGDPVRNLHMRSWARRGSPVVKEHQEEYLARAAIVVDDAAPRDPTRPFVRPPHGSLDRGARRLEAAISVAAGAAARLTEGDTIVDVVVVGAHFERLASARGDAGFEAVLESLATASARRERSFSSPPEAFFEEARALSAVVVVLTDWDEARAACVRRLREIGIDVQAILVRDEPPTLSLDSPKTRDVGAVVRRTVAEIERALMPRDAIQPSGERR